MKFTEVITLVDLILDKDYAIKAGSTVMITKGLKSKYALWHSSGVYDLPDHVISDLPEINLK